MSFVNSRISLPRTAAPQHKFKHCSKCDQPRAPEGGIEMSPTRWICASCWTLKAVRQPKKS